MGALHPLILLLAVSAFSAVVLSHNITDILSGFPEYSSFNSYLTQTRLADEINSRQTLTILALNNAATSNLAAKHPLSVVKKLLSLHVLLDYFDPPKLHRIPQGTTLTTSLYQTTGDGSGTFGFVNITDLRGGKVGFGPAAAGSKLDSTFIKPVKLIPYNISVVEVSAGIVYPEILSAPAGSDVNVTDLLEKADCKRFASLIVSSGVIKVYESAIPNGLTVFAPSDGAFQVSGVPDLSKVKDSMVVSLLQYHASAQYLPIGTLKIAKDPISTLASGGAGKYDFTVNSAGDSVTLNTGVDSSQIASTVLDSAPLCIFTVDNLLLPSELFVKSPSPAPAIEPVMSPSPAPVVAARPAPVTVEAPSALAASPPAPPMESPDGAPADAPESESDKSMSDNGAVHVKARALFSVLVTVSATVISATLSS